MTVTHGSTADTNDDSLRPELTALRFAVDHGICTKTSVRSGGSCTRRATHVERIRARADAAPLDLWRSFCSRHNADDDTVDKTHRWG